MDDCRAIVADFRPSFPRKRESRGADDAVDTPLKCHVNAPWNRARQVNSRNAEYPASAKKVAKTRMGTNCSTAVS